MKKLLLVLPILATVGCADLRVLDATVMSTKNMDIKRTRHRVDETVRVTGEDERHTYVLTGDRNFPSIKEAMDRAIEKNNGCVGLSNVVIDFHERIFPFIYASRVFEVSGNPIYEADKK